MPMITVTIDDERHPDFEEAVAYLDNHANVDWDDMQQFYPPQEIETYFDTDEDRDEGRCHECGSTEGVRPELDGVYWCADCKSDYIGDY